MDRPQLIMIRRTLENIPEPSLPEGYRFRCFEDGDMAGLEEVFRKCFDPGWNRDRVVKTFMSQVLWSPQRMTILLHEKHGAPGIPACPTDADRNICATEIVGTATAWEDAKLAGHAMLHYVAVHPDHAGKKLGFSLVARTMQMMRSFGYRDAWLSTDDWRLPAIVVYLRLGFEPAYDHESHRERWQIVKHKLLASGRDAKELEKIVQSPGPEVGRNDQ